MLDLICTMKQLAALINTENIEMGVSCSRIYGFKANFSVA